MICSFNPRCEKFNLSFSTIHWKEVRNMGDKNPKKPLKPKKATQKMNEVQRHAEAEANGKAKK